MVEIRDYQSAYNWLSGQDRSTRLWFAARNALRAFPAFQYVPYEEMHNMALNTFRALLISSSTSNQNEETLAQYENACQQAFFAARTALSDARRAPSAMEIIHTEAYGPFINVGFIAASAAKSNGPHDSAVRAASRTVEDSQSFAGEQAANEAATKDANLIRNWHPLWHSSDPPPQISSAWSKVKKRLSTNRNNWSFWIEWYEAILMGRPLD